MSSTIRRRPLTVALLTILFTLFGMLSVASANDIHDAAYDATYYDYIKDAGQSTEHSLGQGFQTGAEFSGARVHHVALWMQRVGSAENACVWVSIRATYNGSDLAYKCVNAQTMSTSAQWVDFIFDTPLTITPGGTYFIYARYYGSCDTCIKLFNSHNNSYKSTSWPTVVIGQDNATCCYQRPNDDLAFLLAIDHTAKPSNRPAGNIGANQADFYAHDDDDSGLGADLYFKWGTTTSYGNETGRMYCPQYSDCLMTVNGLSPSTTYHYQACLENDVGDQCATGDVSFTTQAAANNPPYTPNSPSPSHTTTNVSVGTNLNWSGGDPNGNTVTYSVYLNAGTTASTLRCSTTSTTCSNGSLGGLAYNTQYAWRVVASDGIASPVNGPTWTFTTGSPPNNPPYTPSSPSPGDGVTGVATSTGLSFSGGDPNGGTVTYSVYLNAGSTASTLRCTTTSTSCPNSSLGGLATGTQYAWRVVASDGVNSPVNGPTWTFTTAVSPPTACWNYSVSGFTLNVDGSCSTPSSGLTYSWNWGDGSPTSSGVTANHSYACPGGTYTVRLTVSNAGGSHQFSRNLTIQDTTDNDADGLVACREASQMTSDSDSDADDDALSDYIESQWYPNRNAVFCNATVTSCSYPNPLRKDIYVEMDYMGTGPLAADADLDRIVVAFDDSPNAGNPDGSTGIAIHLDAGNARASRFDIGGGNTVTVDTNLGTDNAACNNYDWTEFNNIKATNFATNRTGIYHYMIWAYHLATCRGTTSGIAGLPGSDFIVSLRGWGCGTCFGSANERTGTFMHELGHNLGLGHGGRDTSGNIDEINDKPNYRSVMGYIYQTRGIPHLFTDAFDYSHEALPNLNEASLNENNGVGSAAGDELGVRWWCGDPDPELGANGHNPVDWNCNGTAGGTVVADVNGRDAANDNSATRVPCTATTTTGCQVLEGHADWGHLVFDGGTVGPGSCLPLVLPIPVVPPCVTPGEEDEQRFPQELTYDELLDRYSGGLHLS